MTNCDDCGVSVQRYPLYRTNEKGVPGIFKCELCMSKPPDAETKSLCDVIARPMNTLLLASLLLLLPALVEAQTVPMTVGANCKFTWTANTEPDMKEYKLRLQRGGVQMPDVTIPFPATEITCKAAGVQSDGSWLANLHAVNAIGNMSGPSN